MPAPPPEPPPLNVALLAVSAGAAAQLDPLWVLPSPDVIQALFDVLPTVVDTWTTAAATVAADWYDQLRASREVKGTFEAMIKPLVDPGVQALAGWGAQPLAKLADIQDLDASPIDTAKYRVESGLQKRLVNAANLTLTDSATEDPQARGWMRVTRPNACGFCKMVASRGGVFAKATATFACHEHCYCSARPYWSGDVIPVNPYKPSAKQTTPADRARVRRWIKENLE